MLNIKYKTVYFVFLLLVSLVFISPVHAAITYFSDDFESGSSKWIVVRNYQYLDHSLPCMNNFNPSTWTVLNGEYGIKISDSYCVTESVPKDEFWNSEWSDYIYELDVHMISGVDKNIAWRYLDENNWLGVHVVSPWAYFQRVVQDFHTNYQQLYDGHTYHLK